MASALNNTASKPQTPPKPKRRFTLTGVLIGVGVALAVLFIGILIVRAQAPSAPSGLTATAVSPSQINLTWTDNANDEAGFEVARGTSSYGPWTTFTQPANTTAFQDTGLANYTRYFYRVRAFNADMVYSFYSNLAYATTLSGPPAAPSNLTATAVSQTEINVSWTNNAPVVDWFIINRSGGPYSDIKTWIPSPRTSYTETNLLPNTTYTFSICATNSYGETCSTETASATTFSPPPPDPPPAMPTNLEANIQEVTKIKLTWQDNSDNETRFELRQGEDPNTLNLLPALPANATTYTTNNLTENKTYYFNIKACNADGCSDSPTIAQATTNTFPPTNLTATAATDSLKINLAWQDHTTIETNYIVEKSPGDDQHFTILATLPANTVTYTDTTDLVADTTYYYKVRGKLNDTTFTDYTNTVFATPTYKYTGVNPGWIGKTPSMGSTKYTAMSNDGHYTYVGSSTGLQIVDISDPTNPLLTSRINVDTGKEIFDIKVDEKGYIYYGENKKLKIANINDPKRPIAVSELELTDYVNGLFYLDEKIYIANYSVGLRIVDVSNRSIPRLLDTTIDTPGQASSVAVLGDTAVVADGTEGVAIIDLKSAQHLSSIPITDTASIVRNVTIAENGRAYIPAGYAGLLEIDFSTPSIPILISTSLQRDYAIGVSTSGNRIYVANLSRANTHNGLQIFDVTQRNPDNSLKEIAFMLNAGNNYGGVSSFGGIVSVASGNLYGLAIFDTNDLTNTWAIAYIPTINIPSGKIVTSGNHLYTFSNSGIQDYLYIYDISDPKYPEQVGALKLTSPIALEITGNYVVVSDDKYIRLVDVSNPRIPTIISGIEMPDYVLDVSIKDNKIYAACYEAGLVIVDMNNVLSLKKLGSYNTPGQVFGVALNGTTAVIADGTAGITLLNVSNANALTWIKTIATTQTTHDVAVGANNYAYVAAFNQGTLIVNLTTNPFNASIVREVIPRDMAYSVFLQNNLVYIANYSWNFFNNGLQIIDISNPTMATEKAFLQSSFHAMAATANGRYAYITDEKYLVEVADLYYDYLKVEQTSSCGGTEGCTSANHGQEITYTLKITNPTPYTFTGNNNILSNEIPDGTTYVQGSVTGGGQYGSGKITWNLGQVNPNEEREVSFKVTVN